MRLDVHSLQTQSSDPLLKSITPVQIRRQNVALNIKEMSMNYEDKLNGNSKNSVLLFLSPFCQ